MRRFDIWAEGFAATGQEGRAIKLGTGKGNTFRDACIDLLIGNTYFNSDTLTYWGCRLFDNEISARRSFG